MWKSAALKTCFEAIYWSGLGRVMSSAWGGTGVIFCLHHVVPKPASATGFAPNANLETTPQFLEEIILLVKRKGYRLLSLTDAVEQLKSGEKSQLPFAVFTLDDGYKDNLVHAMPVFEKHHCPFTVYVAPRIADGTCELWWRGLEAIITKSNALLLEVESQTLNISTSSDVNKWQAWDTLFPLVQAMPEHAQRDWILRETARYGIDLHGMCRNAAMTWDEIREMNQSPLATIGAHTLNHYNLLKLPESDARREITRSRERIETELGESIVHFAYPYGNKDAAGLREFTLCKEAGYQSAVVTRLGTVTATYADHCFALPRIMVSSRYAKPRYIEALISGIPGRLANKGHGLNIT
jgi:peptidoglycan/xylan/chitin deacetylase (PgdA/CDA1 family)